MDKINLATFYEDAKKQIDNQEIDFFYLISTLRDSIRLADQRPFAIYVHEDKIMCFGVKKYSLKQIIWLAEMIKKHKIKEKTNE